MKRASIAIILVLIVTAIAASLYVTKKYSPSAAEMASLSQKPYSSHNKKLSLGVGSKKLSDSTTSTPESNNEKSTLLLPVPFTPQAPTGNWDTIHNEDCEEASAIMANAYYNGPHDTKLNAAYVEEQLSALTDWELKTFGYNLDINSEETAQLIKTAYGLQTKIIYNFNESDIKNELAQNHLVLIPENGQLIGNPNYKAPGPKYHMLVIRGYTETSIITNDSGTRNGQNYSYNFSVIYTANGNYDHVSQKVDTSKKNIIVVWK